MSARECHLQHLSERVEILRPFSAVGAFRNFPCLMQTNVVPRGTSPAVPLNVSIDVEGGITGAVLGLVLSGKLRTTYWRHKRPTHQEALCLICPLSTVEELLNLAQNPPYSRRRKQYRKELNQMVCQHMREPIDLATNIQSMPNQRCLLILPSISSRRR